MYENLEPVAEGAKALIFDFDGTLVDSNPVKLRAFEKCFARFGDRREEILRYCFHHHHVSRFQKFRHVFENILKRPYTKETEKKMLDHYARETTNQVIDAPEIPGALAFLKRWKQGRRTALLSSTPHDILLHILEKREMRSLFSLVQGAPVHKASWLRQFKEEELLQPGEVVFFGDSYEDESAAKEANVTFVKIGGAREILS